MNFQLGNLELFVCHDKDTYETYVLDPYEVDVIVPIVGVNGPAGSLIFCPSVRPEPFAVQECLTQILEAMQEAAPALGE